MKGKKLLAGVTGVISPGKVTAVMGPSGAGKTTFLSTLLGKATYAKFCFRFGLCEFYSSWEEERVFVRSRNDKLQR